MPALPPLALRYLLWLIGLRFAYIAAVTWLGLPNTLATGVILASVPAADIGFQAVRRATGPLALRDWARIWGVMISIYVVVNLVIPAMLVPQFRALLSDPAGLRGPLLVTLATAAMLALFLWIGTRAARARRG